MMQRLLFGARRTAIRRLPLFAAIALCLPLAGGAAMAAEPNCPSPVGIAKSLVHQRANLLAARAAIEQSRGDIDAALRYAAEGTRLDLSRDAEPSMAEPSMAARTLAAIVETTHELRVLDGHAGAIRNVDFNPDATRLVTSSDDKAVIVWDVRTARALLRLPYDGEAYDSASAAFSADGSKVTVFRLGKVTIWDAASGRKLMSIATPDDAASVAVTFTPDGKRAVVTLPSKIETFDIADGRLVSTVPHTEPRREGGPAWSILSPDKRHRIEFDVDSSDVTLTDTRTRKQMILRGQSGGMLEGDFSPDGQRIWTLSEDGAPRIWTSATGTLVAVLRGGKALTAEFSGDGNELATGTEGGTARIWSLTPPGIVATVRPEPHRDLVTKAGTIPVRTLSAAFSPDGATFVTVEWDGTARVWSTAGRPLLTLRDTAPIVLAAFGADGRQLVTATEATGLQQWDVATGTRLGLPTRLAGAGKIQDISPDAARVVTTAKDGTVGIYDVATGALVAARRLYENEEAFARFTGDGTRIVTRRGRHQRSDGTVTIWDPARPDEKKVIAQDDVDVAALSPDGSRLLTSDDISGPTRLWDMTTGKPIGDVEAKRGELIAADAVAFSPDGRRLAIATTKTVQLWDVASRHEIVQLDGGGPEVTTLAFSRDGTRLLAARADGTTRVYDVRAVTMPAKALLAETCRLRLAGISKLSPAEMDEVGYPDAAEVVDGCAGQR